MDGLFPRSFSAKHFGPLHWRDDADIPRWWHVFHAEDWTATGWRRRHALPLKEWLCSEIHSSGLATFVLSRSSKRIDPGENNLCSALRAANVNNKRYAPQHHASGLLESQFGDGMLQVLMQHFAFWSLSEGYDVGLVSKTMAEVVQNRFISAIFADVFPLEGAAGAQRRLGNCFERLLFWLACRIDSMANPHRYVDFLCCLGAYTWFRGIVWCSDASVVERP